MAAGKLNGKRRRVLTFSKGRADLVKKARQLAVLCSSMKSIIRSCSQAACSTHASPSNNKPENRILKEMKQVQQRQRKNRGEENMALISFKNLQKLEATLELGLSKVRLQKEKRLAEHMEEVSRKVRFYKEQNLSKEYDDLRKQAFGYDLDQLEDAKAVLQESRENFPI